MFTKNGFLKTVKVDGINLSRAPLEMAHFPTRAQAFVWRNWGLVPPERLAQTLKTSLDNLYGLAIGMGLPECPKVDTIWMKRGFITIIRRNWHLLPYEQLLELLEWTSEKLAFTLKEDDFLWHKLGDFKPEVEPLRYAPLTKEEARRTEELRETVKRHFPRLREDKPSPFAFLHEFNSITATPVIADLNGDLRLIYSYSALYGDALSLPELDPYPDGLLRKYAELGVNGIWLQGVLYSLIPWDKAPEMSDGWQERLDNLRKLTKRAGKHGIGVYLYINEPRGPQARFREMFNGIANDIGGMCASRPETLDYLETAMEKLFQAVPELAGAFTITMAENATHCYSRILHSPEEKPKCPLCAKRDVARIVAEINRRIASGAHKAKPSARIIAWTWFWHKDWAEKAVEALPDDVEVMCVSEWGVPTIASGIGGIVVDYSISKPGPGTYAKDLWKKARDKGLKTIAKIQVNNTWELSAVPYLPVMGLVERHLRNLRDEGVSDFMLSWTLGGYPALNFELLRKSKEQIAVERFGEKAAPLVLNAWDEFSRGFSEFPFNGTGLIYVGPQNYGPMNLLYARPTGWKATMLGYPYDDLEGWGARFYTAEILEKHFRLICSKWESGMKALESAATLTPPKKQVALTDLRTVSEAVYCHFKSALNQIAFIRGREKKPATDELLAILDDEIKLAKRLCHLTLADSRIGYEASNHYYYTINDMVEKVINCEFIKKQLP